MKFLNFSFFWGTISLASLDPDQDSDPDPTTHMNPDPDPKHSCEACSLSIFLEGTTYPWGLPPLCGPLGVRYSNMLWLCCANIFSRLHGIGSAQPKSHQNSQCMAPQINYRIYQRFGSALVSVQIRLLQFTSMLLRILPCHHIGRKIFTFLLSLFEIKIIFFISIIIKQCKF